MALYESSASTTVLPAVNYDPNLGKQIAGMIDHTLLKPEASETQIRRLCAEATASHFASVCVNPGWVPLCAELLAGNTVKVCTVIGFPLGATSTRVKAFESQTAMAAGAQELDMVIAVGALKSGLLRQVQDDIQAVVDVAHAGGAIVKVIIETCLLTDEEKTTACRISVQAGPSLQSQTSAVPFAA